MCVIGGKGEYKKGEEREISLKTFGRWKRWTWRVEERNGKRSILCVILMEDG
jgi:hypothetical protein